MTSFYGNNGTNSGGGQDASAVKAQLDLHMEDNEAHVTAEKQTLWNGKVSLSVPEGTENLVFSIE